MKVHFIAIGGAVMHHLAICLKNQGHKVTGSDDQIYDPAKKNLTDNGILPKILGFDEANISDDLDAVIVGMHAKVTNPELLAANKKGIRIYSFPEYIYEQSKNKKRVVIAGSHGKTTITSMIMHVLKFWKCDFDYMVGASIKDFKGSVKLTKQAPVIILEGDEYMSSPIDKVPKFLYYRPQIALISGISWDHINVFPTYRDYFTQFIQFIATIEENGTLIYNTEDPEVRKLSQLLKPGVNKFPYHTPGFIIDNHVTYLSKENRKIPLKIFGEHNLQNLQGSRIVCNELGISDDDFYQAIQSFEGASRRLELINSNNFTAVFRDFAHAPSKLKASIKALKGQFPDRKLVACMELHTFSSLNKDFLAQYANSMDDADIPIIYFNPKVIADKKLEKIDAEDVWKAFRNQEILIINDHTKLEKHLRSLDWKKKNLVLMSSGNFSGMNSKELADFITYNGIQKKE